MSKKQEAKAKKQETPEDVTPVRNLPCARCGGSDRKPDVVIVAQPYAGVENGRPFTHIVRSVSRCTGCGQSRIKRAVENRQADVAPEALENVER